MIGWERAQGTFCGDGNVVCVDCGGSYMAVYIFQNNCKLNICIVLYLNYTSIKLKMSQDVELFTNSESQLRKTAENRKKVTQNVKSGCPG